MMTWFLFRLSVVAVLAAVVGGCGGRSEGSVSPAPQPQVASSGVELPSKTVLVTTR